MQNTNPVKEMVHFEIKILLFKCITSFFFSKKTTAERKMLF